MVSRRQFLIGTASTVGAATRAGCYDSSSTSAPEWMSWVPASFPTPTSLNSIAPSTLVEYEATDITSEDTIYGLAPADMDAFVTIQGAGAGQHTAIDGQFERETARDGLSSQLPGSLEEREDYSGYTRLSAEQTDIAITDDRMIISQGAEMATLESIIDAKTGGTDRFYAENTYAKRLADELGSGDVVDLSISTTPDEIPSNVTANATDVPKVAGSGSSVTVAEETSEYVTAVLYTSAAAAEPETIRDSLNATTVSNVEITTDDGLVVATGDIPTDNLNV